MPNEPSEWAMRVWREALAACYARGGPLEPNNQAPALVIDREVKALRDALEKARDQFEWYAKNHFDKRTKDGDQKAAVNHALALEMDEALEPKP